ncbi:hypothetical protein ACFT2C_06085 [Promicromonospora sp. NPDC057138]|uniref:hypothetical protein n=1 Tax=Promicromonospora sp. NPDC057138 TaxID=3346031 RepID=UPI0036404DD3
MPAHHHDMTDLPRRPAGAPDSSGGQFAPNVRSAADLDLDDDTAAISIEALGLAPGATEHVDGYDLQSPYFEWADIVADEDGSCFRVRAGVALGVRAGLANLLDGHDDSAAEGWLTDHALPIEAWFADEYGVQELSGDDWDFQDAVVVLEGLDPTTGTDELTDLLESRTKAVALHDDADPSSPAGLWPRLTAHLREFDQQVDDAIWAYTNAALWTDGDHIEQRTDGGSWSPDDLDPASRATLEHEVRRFLTVHRESIAQAREAVAGYDGAQIGHDLWLTRNGHGTGFWDRGLGDAGDHLSDAVRGHTVDLSVSKDGALVIE